MTKHFLKLDTQSPRLVDRKQSAVRSEVQASELLEGRPLKQPYVTVPVYKIFLKDESTVGIRILVLRNRKTEFAREI